jgi:hypothetical protein
MTSTPWDDPEAGRDPRIRPFLETSLPGSVSGPDVPTRRQAASGQDPPAGPRPFVLTSGRVAGLDPDIGLETQVSTRPDADHGGSGPVSTLPSEQRGIVELCAETLSVAEISARLGLHLGVTRVLVGDLRAAGYLDVYVVDPMTPHDPDTILRVMRGLLAIS